MELGTSVHILQPRIYCKVNWIDVSFSCACPVIDHEFRRNIVKAVDPPGDSRVDRRLL